MLFSNPLPLGFSTDAFIPTNTPVYPISSPCYPDVLGSTLVSSVLLWCPQFCSGGFFIFVSSIIYFVYNNFICYDICNKQNLFVSSLFHLLSPPKLGWWLTKYLDSKKSQFMVTWMG